jgi:hypothetical protein
MAVDVDREARKYILRLLRDALEADHGPAFDTDEALDEADYDAIYDRARGLCDELHDTYGVPVPGVPAGGVR